MKQIIFIGFFFIYTTVCYGQGQGAITITQDDRITLLMEKNKIQNLKKKGTDGYRVQIHFSANRDAAREVKSRFLSAYPETEVYELYQQPNFKIRVGDCRTRFEAEKLQKEIVIDFPNSFIVQDAVNPKLLINEPK
ncbi:MAG: SPOR domain-containing protein [Bacteroidia bacterium]|nr:SPOR domain-containing protein [Bacteroidia bacterium]